MPTYSYECTECGDRFDIVQAFTDDALTTCERCSGRLRKRFNSVGIVFKGSGFYRTDSRESASKATGSSNGSSTSDSGSTPGSSEKSASSEKSGSGETKSSSSTPSAPSAPSSPSKAGATA